jgi:hypothetical protein
MTNFSALKQRHITFVLSNLRLVLNLLQFATICSKLYYMAKPKNKGNRK